MPETLEESKVENKKEEESLDSILESLSKEIDESVEDSCVNKSKNADLNAESECLSDVEMRLVIDETPEESAVSKIEQSSGLNIVKDEKIDIVHEDIPKAEVKVEEVEDKKKGRRSAKGKSDKKRLESRAKTISPKEEKSEVKTKIEEPAVEIKNEEVPLAVQDVVETKVNVEAVADSR